MGNISLLDSRSELTTTKWLLQSILIQVPVLEIILEITCLHTGNKYS